MISDEKTGRYRQRRRTRGAIVEATMALMADGHTPSVAEIADAADVSRRTVYLHFPTLEQLLVDATVGRLSQQAVDDAIEAADVGDDPVQRVTAMVEAISRHADETLPLGRSLIRLTVDAPSVADDGSPRRGFRRVQWIEQAIAPLRESLDEAAFEQLVSGLAMVIGWEALIVLQDVRGLSRDEQHDVTLWAARALIEAALRARSDE
jgi:AcrR family transcriptional regulator